MGIIMKFSRQDFRQSIRQRRNQLSEGFQHQAGRDLCQQFLSLPEVKPAQHIALYLSADGEVDTMPLIEELWRSGKHVYLPVIHPFSKGHLLFLHYTKHSPMVLNKYQIAEPKLDQTQIIPAQSLDVICTPLVGFDSAGHRLGMGGGYYDRTLAPWFKTGQGPKPIGLAHDCQHVDALPIESWDIPLPKIVTPTKVWQW
ncbi:5-formyltetrahydrofolate cyclo-ligase [Vibrio orientalis CIP 102891 = ATCC 33934]|uniref:5-formyltetrahydrofolate cyclo-ligase n=2 Tax=Vibrio orientalis CIP 102891 = ATCC 33934 TaxID=675816 RepID=F9STK1_VIBOR|nr:5-formyltetrahydrofolate cyclo-ligase [Vibrio orientalis CIP 102891 = ATCC 33934]